MTSNRTHTTTETVEMPKGLADPEMRIYGAFAGALVAIITALFWVPGIG